MKTIAVLPLLLLSATALAQDEGAEEAAEAAEAAPVTYAMGDSGSRLYVITRKDSSTLASALSHDHAIEAKGWTGSITWTDGDPSACKLEFSVPAGQLVVDPSDLRSKAGLEGEGPGDSDKETIKEGMLGKDQLDASSHPNITFSSSGCSGSGTSITVKGTFTLRGKGKAVSVPLTISAADGRISAAGSFDIKATDHGFEPFSALFGQLKNLDEMTIVLDVKGSAR